MIWRLKASILTKRPAESDVSDIITMTNLAQTFHVLPSAGGLLDQDSLIMFLMTVVTDAQNQKQQEEMKQQERKARSGSK